MGQVMVIFKVLPDEVGGEVVIKKKIQAMNGLNIKDIQEEDIAFGLKALKVGIVIEDSEGSKTSEIEEKFTSIEGVKSAEMVDSTLL